ncbi:hypothetical protein M3Y98_00331600 [Aphelenchoides besseyi]|nr:hypothetical protein M3Y98_00331600 [Aphelenchoides besseyi]
MNCRVFSAYRLLKQIGNSSIAADNDLLCYKAVNNQSYHCALDAIQIRHSKTECNSIAYDPKKHFKCCAEFNVHATDVYGQQLDIGVHLLTIHSSISTNDLSCFYRGLTGHKVWRSFRPVRWIDGALQFLLNTKPFRIKVNYYFVEVFTKNKQLNLCVVLLLIVKLNL